jgi:2-pyrone-4,6-dicarboxylate lactonase
VATVRRSVTDDELRAMHAAGVRGVRFNFVKRLVDFTPKDELMEIAARIKPLGWHVVIYFERSTCPSCGISSPPCRPPWWSTTWAAPT